MTRAASSGPLRRSLPLGLLLVAAGCVHAGPAAGGAAPLVAPVRLDEAPRTAAERALPLAWWIERTAGGEPEAVHVLRMDLHDRRLEVDAIIADDPDGEGPAEAALTDPRDLARREGALAAVNANAFAGLPDSTGRRDERWREGLPVDIAGVALHGGVRRSGPGGSSVVDLCFGLDRRGRPYLGPASAGSADLREAVNGWWYLLVAHGAPVPASGGVRHPRTAVGLDSSGRWLYLVVVDGRQPGYSVGMTARELADLMVRLGADRALNLDGGGSSVMLIGGGDAGPEIVNRPSGGQPRPVPVLLAARRRTAPQ